jgi:hypothetical protein
VTLRFTLKHVHKTFVVPRDRLSSVMNTYRVLNSLQLPTTIKCICFKVRRSWIAGC